jgi:hypothetical protein
MVMALVSCVLVANAKDRSPKGLVVASTGNQVVIVNPTTGDSRSIETGPVAWLFPAPRGVLFAPDLVNGKTTVIDLRSLAGEELIEGVTMPHFGSRKDRYLVLANKLLVMSYPDRALMNSFEVDFEHPWQVEILADNTVLMVLERLPEGTGEASLTAMDLSTGRLVYRRQLGGGVRHFALSAGLGVLALAAAEDGRVVVVDPATLIPVAAFSVPGKPIDLVFTDEERTLVVAVARADGGGELVIWKIKKDKKLGVRRGKERKVLLGAAPVRLASSPGGRHVAVATTSGEMLMVELAHQLTVATTELPEAPRDVVWCDPSIEGPLVPDWSDDDKPTLDLGGR